MRRRSRPRFPYGKSCPNYRAASPRSAPLDRGNKARGGLIRIKLLGMGPEKTPCFPPLFPFVLHCCPHLLLGSSCSLPLGSGGRGAEPSPSCAGMRMFLGDRQISGLAPAQRTGGLVMQIHTMKLDENNPETMGEKLCRYFVFPLFLFKTEKIHSEH